MKKEDEMELYLLIATFRCFSEQLYQLKGAHSQGVKMWFNRLVKTSRKYESMVDKWTSDNKKLDVIYDELMDVIITVKQNIINEMEEKKGSAD